MGLALSIKFIKIRYCVVSTASILFFMFTVKQRTQLVNLSMPIIFIAFFALHIFFFT